MALYDDAKIMFLASAAARTDTKDFSKIQCVKPVEAVSSTDLVINGDFSIDGPGTDGALTTSFGSYGWNTVATDESGNVQEGTTTIKNGVLKLTNASGDVDCRAYITNGSNSRNLLTTNSYYKLVYTIVENDGCTNFKIYNGAGAAEDAPSSVGTHTRVVRNTSNQLFLFFNKTESSSISIDNVSLKEFTTRNADFDISRDADLDATRVGPTGLIEKGRENLILQSNGFDTTWSAVNVTVTGGQEGYDGSSDAWELKMTGAQDDDNEARIRQTGISVSGVCTYSVFAKAGNVNFVRLIGVVDGTTNPIAFFDLSGNGSVTSSTSSVAATSIESFGNGWFRVSFTHKGAANPITDVRINISDGDDDVYVPTGSFIYIQDSQLEAGLVATDVITTGAATATAGIKEDEPRFDYPLAGGAPSLLIEPQRHNKVPHSEYFGGWTASNSTVTDNNIISPEGVKNGAKLLASGSGDVNHQIDTPSLDGFSGSAITGSIFAKKGNTDFVRLRLNGTSSEIRAWFNLSSGAVGTVDGGGAGTITDMGDGWYRCTVTEAGNTNTTGLSLQVFVNESDGQTTWVADGDEYIYIYGAQLEEGSNSAGATSYIPCHGTSATRSADVLPEVTHGITGGLGTAVTVLLEGRVFGGGGQISHLQLRVDDSNRFLFFTNSSSVGSTHDINVQHKESNVGKTINKTGLTRGDIFKCIGRVDGTTFNMFVNGVKLGTTQTVVAADIYDKISLIRNGDTTNQSGHKNKSVVVWASALTDAQCIALTKL